MTSTNADLLKKSFVDNSPQLKNQDLIELNELNRNSNGGTELITRAIFDQIPREYLEKVQIITSRVRDIDPNRIKIYHLHDLALDPESSHLSEESSRNRFDKLVFVSNWQYQQFRDILGVPYSSQSTVIENGMHPIEYKDKPKDKIRLIYTSTPHRGLEILIPVFVEVAKRYPDIELDVFSSFGIYGWQQRDEQYEPLFKICRDHPQINYHGWQPNDVVRAAYQKAHIFAYPCIWQETSCRSLVEAMSAGCVAVHPNFSALPDTAGGMTIMYDGDSNYINHANIFAHNLMHSIETVKNNDLTNLLQYVKNYSDNRFGWNNVGMKWISTIGSLISESQRV